MTKILIIANHYITLKVFRREFIKKLSSIYDEVVVCIPKCDEENTNILSSYGCRLILTEDIYRRDISPLSDLKLIMFYKKLLKTENPDKLITYTIKPNIYACFLAGGMGIPSYPSITGLGSAFQKESILKKMITLMYKAALKKSEKIFFENEENCNTFVNLNIVKKQQCVTLHGAGVNLCAFPFEPYPKETEPVRFLFMGRIMKEKGMDELLYAIKKIKAEYKNVEFNIIGFLEENYYEPIFNEMTNNGLLNFYGFCEDVIPYIKKSSCIILPSYHEGMSNTILESSSCGRPVIATKIHGCMEAVIDNRSGFLCEPKNGEDLYRKIKKFIELPYSKKQEFGLNARHHMELNFDKEDVVNEFIKNL